MTRRRKDSFSFVKVGLVGLVLVLASAGGTVLFFKDREAASQAADQRKYMEELREWRPLAEAGDTSARNILGVMYEQGRGVSQDFAEAVKWYRLAAEQGHALGQNNLGYMYYFGRGVSQDFVEAAKWFRLAAEQEVVSAQWQLASLSIAWEVSGIGNDDKTMNAEAMKWLHRAAEQGDVSSQVILSIFYSGNEIAPQDLVQARMWREIAVALGDEDGREFLAIQASKMTPAQIAEAQRLAKEWLEAHQ